MKKLFLLLALAGVMVACGGEQKKDEKKNDATEQKAEAKAPATMVEFAEAALAAAEAGDVKKYDELDKAAEEHAMELDKPENKEQSAKETKELMEWVEKNGDRLMKAQQKLEEARKADAENVKKNKKEEAAKADTKNVKETNSVDALVKKTVKAMQTEDYAALESIMVEYEKLSREDQAKFDAAIEKEMMM